MTTSVSVQNLDLNFGSVKVLKDLSIDIGQGEFLVLLGPSGCGKSTLLNCLAGLLDVSGGQIHISGENVTWAEPKDRGIGMVFQSYALYPQMTVRGNLEFGLKNQKLPKEDIAKRVANASEILQIEELLERKPAALSGGQRQRVAIGRALVRDVDVFLFDEPLSNLDAKLRAELRVELKRLHNQLNNTMIYVTHDQIEALTLADRIAIMRGGYIQQLADPLTVYNKPSNLFVAGFIGSPSMSFFDGDITGGGKKFDFSGVSVALDGYDGEGEALSDAKGVLGVRPEHVLVHTDAGSDRIEATLDIIEPLGSNSLLWLNISGTPVSALVKSEDVHPLGTKLYLDFDMSKASVFDAETEARL